MPLTCQDAFLARWPGSFSKNESAAALALGQHKDIVGPWQAAAKKVGMPFDISEHLASSYRTTQTNKGAVGELTKKMRRVI